VPSEARVVHDVIAQGISQRRMIHFCFHRESGNKSVKFCYFCLIWSSATNESIRKLMNSIALGEEERRISSLAYNKRSCVFHNRGSLDRLKAELSLRYLFICHDLGVVEHVADRIAGQVVL